MRPPDLRFVYTNWHGERSTRSVGTPLEIRFGTTKHHPDPQWLLDAFDLDKAAHRTFALKDCDFTLQGLAVAGVERSIDQISDSVLDRFNRIEGMLLEARAVLAKLIDAAAGGAEATHKFETPPPWVEPKK
jgi:hypothetical protein